MSKCDVCHKQEIVSVHAMPMIPMTVGYCLLCDLANAHPWEVLVANAWQIGGLQNANDDFKAMVKDTCSHLRKTEAQFTKAVARLGREIEKDLLKKAKKLTGN